MFAQQLKKSPTGIYKPRLDMIRRIIEQGQYERIGIHKHIPGAEMYRKNGFTLCRMDNNPEQMSLLLSYLKPGLVKDKWISIESPNELKIQTVLTYYVVELKPAPEKQPRKRTRKQKAEPAPQSGARIGRRTEAKRTKRTTSRKQAAHPFEKAIQKAKEKGDQYFTARVDQVKKLIERGQYDRIICKYSYTDDYAWDAENDYGRGRIDKNPEEMKRLMDWLKPGTRCYGEVDNPFEIRISPYTGLLYVVILQNNQETADNPDNQGNQDPTPETEPAAEPAPAVSPGSREEKAAGQDNPLSEQEKIYLMIHFDKREYKAILAALRPSEVNEETAKMFASPKMLFTLKVWRGIVHLLDDYVTRQEKDHFWTYDSWAEVETVKAVREKILTKLQGRGQ